MPDGVVFTDPGEYNFRVCNICGEEMDAKRNIDGPTGFAEDAFYCPCREEMWHKQICRLNEETRKCPSNHLSTIMIAEAALVLKTRQATKEVSQY